MKYIKKMAILLGISFMVFIFCVIINSLTLACWSIAISGALFIWLTSVWFTKPLPIPELSNYIPLDDKYRLLYLIILKHLSETSLEDEFDPNIIASKNPSLNYGKTNYEYLFERGYISRGKRGKYVLGKEKYEYIMSNWKEKADLIMQKNKRKEEQKRRIFGIKETNQ